MNTFGDYFKHEAYKDIAIRPIKIYNIRSKGGYRVKFEYVNIHTDRTMGFVEHMGHIDSIFIKYEDLKKWKMYFPLKDRIKEQMPA